ncbi:DUF418 domain-containing protein [Nonomuraea wenchangensis]|uniref:DUF418 domain-containing protein n=1 Tax=Nonomuraea wenchangensis TaxID=568860 RepID=UPI003716DA6B
MDLLFFPIFSSRGEAPRAAADSMSRAKPMPKSRLLLRRLVTLLAIGLAHYVLVLAAGHLIGGRSSEWSSTTVVLIAAFVLTAQWLFSACWVGRHRYGPVEWLWRWATWARRPPL